MGGKWRQACFATGSSNLTFCSSDNREPAREGAYESLGLRGIAAKAHECRRLPSPHGQQQSRATLIEQSLLDRTIGKPVKMARFPRKRGQERS